MTVVAKITPLQPVVYAIENLLDELGVDRGDENFLDTPMRFATYIKSHFRGPVDIRHELQDLGRTFPSSYEGMVTQKNIKVHGMCPHHLLPIEYNISLAYIPAGRVLGLSKLARIATLYGSLAKLQEDVTKDICDALNDVVENVTGVIVVVEGIHSCMSIRGVKADEAVTVTSAITGKFRDPQETAREEFLALIKG